MASPVSSSGSGWRHLRAQPVLVQAAVWLFALPVPVWLWAWQKRGSDRALALTVAGLITVVCLVVPAYSGASDRSGNAPTTTTTTTTTTTIESRPSTSRPPSTAPVEISPAPTEPTAPASDPNLAEDGPLVLLSEVRIAEELSDKGYDRGLFVHWIDADADGCGTRCEVLAAEQRSDGTWLSVYDNVTTADPAEFDVDHVVALGEAWRSGAADWDPGRRTAFANDLDEPRALVAVSASSNRSKSDRDPSSWLPPNAADRCDYITGWMAVKLKWDLAVDPIEFTALQNIAEAC